MVVTFIAPRQACQAKQSGTDYINAAHIDIL
jgi:hypothetical protein